MLACFDPQWPGLKYAVACFEERYIFFPIALRHTAATGRWMGRFYIHIREGENIIADEEGVELPDASAAAREARLGALELLGDAIKAGAERVPDAFVVADDSGQVVETIPLVALLPKPLSDRTMAPMSSDNEYRRQAAEAEKMAHRAKTDYDREAWLRIAQGWMSLIHGKESGALRAFNARSDATKTTGDDSDTSH